MSKSDSTFIPLVITKKVKKSKKLKKSKTVAPSVANPTHLTLSWEKIDELKELSKPILSWLQRNAHPHVQVHIDPCYIQVHELLCFDPVGMVELAPKPQKKPLTIEGVFGPSLRDKSNKELPLRSLIKAFLFYKHGPSSEAVADVLMRQMPWLSHTLFLRHKVTLPEDKDAVRKWISRTLTNCWEEEEKDPSAFPWSNLREPIFRDIKEFFQSEIKSSTKVITLEKVQEFLNKHPLPWREKQ